MKRYRIFVGALGLVALAVTSRATVLGFDNVKLGLLDPYLGHTEKGYDITPTTSNWVFNSSNGTPIPCIWTDPDANFTPTSEIEVKRSDGGLFVFASVDLETNDSGSRHIFRAYRGGASVMDEYDYLSNGMFWHKEPTILPQIDRLIISLQPGEITIRHFAMDNIEVQSVPESSALLGMVIGLIGIAVQRRKAA